jgi:ornithine carbamoyltransferase
MTKHLRQLEDLTVDDVNAILKTATKLKSQRAQGQIDLSLQGRVVSLVFEKPSLRTRASFEAASMQLGGGSLFFSAADAGLNGRESLADIARVLSSYSDVVVLRTFSQQLIDDFADVSSCPVINGLSDDRHPCQVLTDIFTMQEVFGDLAGRRLVFVGDGNNVSASLALLCSMLGISFTLACPEGYALDDALLTEFRTRYPSADLTVSHDAAAAVAHADVVYTDVWASMGQESEANNRKRDFAPFQVNAALMAHAPSHSRFMHDLPARRGLEVTDEVIDGPASIAFPQAENRMHLAKGLLAWLLERETSSN